MMPVSKLAFGGAALWSLILVAATERDPPRPAAPVPDPITERWIIPEAEALPKADRLTITNSQFVADYEPSAPGRSAANGPPPAPPPVADTDADDLRPPNVRLRSASARQAGVNICIRHGMHKVMTNGGRSWRCRKNGMVKKPRTPRANKKPRTHEQRKRALMRQATSAASDKTNIVGVEKARGRRPRPVTLPAADELRKIRIEADEEGDGE
jgi:type IV secretory pathway VirB10-like protein